MRKPSGYWKNIENVKRELKPLIDKLGRFPSNNEMIKEIGSSLPKYIMKYHGGILHLSQEMGLKNYDESIGRRTQGTWNWASKLVSDFSDEEKNLLIGSLQKMIDNVSN